MSIAITPDRSDPRVSAAQTAEQRLFDHYGLDVETHRVGLASGPHIRVLECGSGPTLLLVPGGVGDGWIWAPLMPELQGYRLLVVNRPGGGLSDGVDHTEVDMQRLAVDTLKSVVDHFRLDQVPIICNSMGGLWSFWFSLAHPESVYALAQLGVPALILGTSAPLPMRLQSVPLLNRLVVRATIPSDMKAARGLPAFLGHPDAVGEEWPEALAECSYHFPRLPAYRPSWLTLMEAALTLRGASPRYAFGAEQLRQVQPPVLYVWGDNDPFGEMDVAHRAQRITPDAELYAWQGGHLPWWDNPEQCARLIEDFLD